MLVKPGKDNSLRIANLLELFKIRTNIIVLEIAKAKTFMRIFFNCIYSL